MLWYLGPFNTRRWHFYTTLFILQSGIAERSSLGYVQVHVHLCIFIHAQTYILWFYFYKISRKGNLWRQSFGAFLIFDDMLFHLIPRSWVLLIDDLYQIYKKPEADTSFTSYQVQSFSPSLNYENLIFYKIILWEELPQRCLRKLEITLKAFKEIY